MVGIGPGGARHARPLSIGFKAENQAISLNVEADLAAAEAAPQIAFWCSMSSIPTRASSQFRMPSNGETFTPL